jgi:hypothetical protein
MDKATRRFKLVESCILRADPKIARCVLVDLPDNIAARRVLATPGKVFFEWIILPGIIVDTAKIRPGPDTTLPVLAERVYGIVRHGVRIIRLLVQIGSATGSSIINIDPRLRRDPELIRRGLYKIPDKDGRPVRVVGKDRSTGAGADVEQPRPMHCRSDKYRPGRQPRRSNRTP